MIFIAILFFILFTKPVLAVAPIVTIIDPIPNNIIVGDEISVTFTVNSLNIGMIYHYKIVGDDNADLSTLPNTSCTSNYENCENLTITADKIATATAKFRLNTSTGTDNIKIRIAQNDKHSSTSDSSYVSISSAAPTSTPTPNSTNTPTPTNIPTQNPPTGRPTLTPTKTPTPTLRSTIDDLSSNLSTPSATPSEIPTINDEPIESIPTEIPQVFGTATDSSKLKSKNIIPGILISIGGILLLTPLILAKIKHGPKKTKSDS